VFHLESEMEERREREGEKKKKGKEALRGTEF
jgi:hypothetical protein